MSAAEAAQALVEGVVLGSYEFLPYKPSGKPAKLAEGDVLGVDGAPAEGRRWRRGAAIGEAVNLARDLVNEPGGDAQRRRLRRPVADARRPLSRPEGRRC